MVLTDELASDPAQVVRRCFQHIGVEPLELPDYPRRNVRAYAPMEPALADALRLFYRDPNERLTALLDHPLPWPAPQGPEGVVEKSPVRRRAQGVQRRREPALA